MIPKRLRAAHGWRAGLELIAETTGDGVLLRPRDVTRASGAQELLGCAGYRGPRRSLADMEAAVSRGARGQR